MLVFNKIQINVPPKKLLPTSPIKILDGCQFHSKNPNKAPVMPHNGSEIKMRKNINSYKWTDRIPSIPSIKLQKLIIPVQIRIIDATKINSNNKITINF